MRALRRLRLACDLALGLWLGRRELLSCSTAAFSSPVAHSICLMSHGKTFAARLGRRPESRHRTGSPRRLIADALCGGCDVPTSRACAFISKDFGFLVT